MNSWITDITDHWYCFVCKLRLVFWLTGFGKHRISQEKAEKAEKAELAAPAPQEGEKASGKQSIFWENFEQFCLECIECTGSGPGDGAEKSETASNLRCKSFLQLLQTCALCMCTLCMLFNAFDAPFHAAFSLKYKITRCYCLVMLRLQSLLKCEHRVLQKMWHPVHTYVPFFEWFVQWSVTTVDHVLLDVASTFAFRC